MSETAEASEQESKPTNTTKRVRHRKKLLYENIRKQMEFYFSDANLSKDRFLGELIKVDPFVPLDTFLKCNKIRAITQDIVDITKALKHSTALELSEDKSKVKRTSPVLPYDADCRTVYVESIPVTGNRDWLQGVFGDYGQVAYISLPKFKNTNRIKGYAFIEYDKPEEAQKCLSSFTKMGCKLSTGMAPEELSTIKMFSVELPTEENGANTKKLDKEDSYEPPKKKTKKNKDKKKNMELKLDSELESDAEKKADTPVDDKKATADEMTSQDESKTDDKSPKKKGRKRSAKERSKARNQLGKNETPKDALFGLQVLSKSEWKSLRNKYLNLQRKNMKELKKNLRLAGNSYNDIPAPSMEIDSDSAHRGEGTVSTKEINTPMKKIPGVFVTTQLVEPCVDVRNTKQQFRSNEHIQFVDVKEGETEVILRFDTAEAATEYCSSSLAPSAVLSGDDEERQWSRARRRPRGRARLLSRADPAAARGAPAPASPQPTATHIRFDDE